jgi:ADP-ribosylglycohydrolase
VTYVVVSKLWVECIILNKPHGPTHSAPFFHARSHSTDDSVLTIAVADVLLNDRPPVQTFKDWGRLILLPE